METSLTGSFEVNSQARLKIDQTSKVILTEGFKVRNETYVTHSDLTLQITCLITSIFAEEPGDTNNDAQQGYSGSPIIVARTPQITAKPNPNNGRKK